MYRKAAINMHLFIYLFILFERFHSEILMWKLLPTPLLSVLLEERLFTRRKCSAVVEHWNGNLRGKVRALVASVLNFPALSKKFDICKRLLEKFDIFSKIFFRHVGNFFRHLCELVLRHQMRVSNYFVNSFYSVNLPAFLQLWLTSSIKESKI